MLFRHLLSGVVQAFRSCRPCPSRQKIPQPALGGRTALATASVTVSHGRNSRCHPAEIPAVALKGGGGVTLLRHCGKNSIYNSAQHCVTVQSCIAVTSTAQPRFSPLKAGLLVPFLVCLLTDPQKDAIPMRTEKLRLTALNPFLEQMSF